MIINYRVLLKQLVSIYKDKGAYGVVMYFIKAINFTIINRYVRGSYSQMGEDLLIDSYFNHRQHGYYIDIGACHPTRLSNTKFFYDKGWHGINIEPNPKRTTSFVQCRPRDINVNVGIGRIASKMPFYEFEASSLSTISKKEAELLIKAGYKLKSMTEVQTCRLSDIMKKYVTKRIDFMTIDTEGMELEVLQSNDWNRFRPDLLCIETIDPSDLLGSSKRSHDRKKNINKFLFVNDYEEFFDNGLNTFYRNIRPITS